MNPTQKQDNHGPDTRTPAQPDLAAMTQQEFHHWATGTRPCPDDGYIVTVAGQRVLDEAPASGVPGTAGNVLRWAALYLERHGWIQGAYYDAAAVVFTPAADMVGALAMVCYGGPCETPTQHFDDPGFLDFEEALLHLDRYCLVHDGCIAYDFNDAPDRQVADVLQALRQAADTTADELVDALKAIDAGTAQTAAIVKAFTPGGIWSESELAALDGGDAR
jgi:hypothetical protein